MYPTEAMMHRLSPICFMVIIGSATLSGCSMGDSAQGGFASRRQIVDAAARCGVPDFKPTKAGVNWAAYVDGEHPDHGPKGNCIYADLQRQGLHATR